jgi:hypothetical protein
LSPEPQPNATVFGEGHRLGAAALGEGRRVGAAQRSGVLPAQFFQQLAKTNREISIVGTNLILQSLAHGVTDGPAGLVIDGLDTILLVNVHGEGPLGRRMSL